MKDPIGRICLMLANAELSSSDLKKFMRWLDTNGPQALEEAILEIRRVASWTGLSRRIYPPIGSEKKTQAKRNVADRVTQILIGETKIPKNLAVELLSKELEKEMGPEYRAPNSDKISFRVWIDQLSQDVPESILLHLATRLRNELVHAAKPDWPLKRT